MRKIGISILSVLPQAYGPNGPQKAWRLAKRTGLDGIQLVPLRAGWNIKSLRALPPEAVISYEGLWENFPLRNLIFDRNLIEEFPQNFPTATAVDLCGGPVEISPNHAYSESFYRTHPYGVVFDSWHIKGLNIENKQQFIRDLIETSHIRLIHFQTRNKEELKEFLCGQNAGWELFIAVVKNTDCPIIIELPFWWLNGYQLDVISERLRRL